ncbi:hypothetical protein WJX72_005242 [[Myrmecia] bisecta]|uniref:Uncharacterized protein n=1 Tax=[Myrmecia] bisecta TaxID=41462 RepID=A0AAW1QA45_9CHLO
MPEFRRMRYTRFCAKERAYTDTLMNCINLVGALVLARITLAHGHHYIAAWILTSALRSVAALALMRWRFSVYSDWRDVICQLGAERLQYLRGLPCEALLFYVQVVFGFVVPSYIVWYCNHKLHEGFERLEAPPPRPAETHSAAQRRRWALSSSQRHGVAAVAFLAFMRGLWELVARFHLQMHLRELGHSWQYPAQAGSYLVDNPTDLLGLLPIVAVVAVRVLAS